MKIIIMLLGNIARMTTGIKEIDRRSVGIFSMTSFPLAALGVFGFTVLPKDLATRCIGFALILVKLLLKKELPKSKS